MVYESVAQALEQLRKLERTQKAYTHALGLVELDASTAAPRDSWEGRGVTMGVLSEAMYHLIANPENGELLSYLKEHWDELDRQARREVELVAKDYEQLFRIPAEEYVAYNVLLNDAQANWETAKNANDFSLFQPYLEKIVDYNRKFAGYYNPQLLPYDALLNEYEEGMTTEILDAFFAQLRSTIVPLLEKIRQKGNEKNPLDGQQYSLEKQKELSKFLMEALGIDAGRCTITESEHPFTTNFNSRDVRITTHYYEDSLTSSMFSVIHEGGHALYELGTVPEFDYTSLSGGVSMGIHESQSRFYENLIGRSMPFAQYLFAKICELFPEQMTHVDAEAFYRAINRVEPGCIRIESDELSYCLHVMVRYEIEKQMIAGTLAVKDVPAEWNRLYQEYLGVDVPNDALGCLQDIHWAGGAIGYFPSYALGSAYGAQMLHVMQKQLGDIWADVEKGDLSPITGWLREHIHQFGSLKKPGQVFADACGTFDAKYYTDYLTEKYSKIYGL